MLQNRRLVARLNHHLIVDMLGSKVSNQNDGFVHQIHIVMGLAVPQKVRNYVPKFKRDPFLAKYILDHKETLSNDPEI